MANIRSGNSYYIDTASVSLSIPGIQVIGIIVAGVGGAAILELGDNVSGASYPLKVHVCAAADTSVFHDFSACPIVFPNGIRVVTATTVAATLILRESKL